MPYAILRTAKLKSHGNIGASLAHTFRTRETPNANPERTPENEVMHGPTTPAGVHEAVRKRLPEKHRKDAVLGIEYFVGASPDWFKGSQDGSGYFRTALEWLRERHGAENVVSATVHRDETSPHMVVYVVPRDESGRLNAKKWLGGKAALSKMQTDFASRVGAPLGLERGIEGSLARHTTIREYYAAVNQPAVQAITVSPELVTPRLLEKGFLTSTYESPEHVARRVAQQVNETIKPIAEQAKAADFERRRASELAGSVGSIQKAIARLQRLANAFEYGLTPQQVAELIRRAGEMRAANKEQQKQAIKAQLGQQRPKGPRI